MVLLLSRSQPGRFDLIRGSATLPFVCPRLAPLNSASTPRKINSFTEHPRRAALALSWR
jgi:hypothetical protein